MSDMVLILFVCLVCLVRMFIEKYQEQGTVVKKKYEYKPVEKSSCSVRYLNDLTRSDLTQLLGGCLFDEEEEETEDLDEIKARFKEKHNKWDKEAEEWVLRPVVDKSDNLFSFNPQAHEELERRNRETRERAKKYREQEFFENFMNSKQNKPIIV